MKTFSRLKNIVNSNLNSALDSIENPEKMIKLMVVELEESLYKVKKTMDLRMVEKRTLEKEIADLKEKSERWSKRAKLAVEQKRDDLAKEALIEKKKIDTRIVESSERLNSIDKILMSEEESVTALSSKLKEIKEKQLTLIARARHAQEKKKVQETIKETESFEFNDKFNELEAKIEQMESAVNISSTNTSTEFENLELNKEIDDELEELKKTLKKGAK